MTHAGQYAKGDNGIEEGGGLVGLHVGCRHRSGNSKVCAICQANEGGVMAIDDDDVATRETGGDAGMFVEALQALILAEADRDDMHGFLSDDDGTSISDESE